MRKSSSNISLQRPSWLPARARLVVTERTDQSLVGEARAGTRALARLVWTFDGLLAYATQLDSKGPVHGLQIEYDDGRPQWCGQFVRGKQHGLSMQLDDRGQPLVVTQFVHGDGVDVWMSCGTVNEVRELKNGSPHGFVRWGNPQQPWDEEHFHGGLRHGIFRQWNDGKLRKGFPRFYVNDKQVSRRAYQAAQARDASLPPYDQREDANRRPMPAVVDEAIARARTLRRELALLEQISKWTCQRDEARPEMRPARSANGRAPRGAATVRKPKKR